MAKRRTKPRFVLHLVAQHRHDDADGMRRLRAVLKLLLRTFGFECRKIDYPQTPTEGPTDAGDGNA